LWGSGEKVSNRAKRKREIAPADWDEGPKNFDFRVLSTKGVAKEEGEPKGPISKDHLGGGGNFGKLQSGKEGREPTELEVWGDTCGVRGATIIGKGQQTKFGEKNIGKDCTVNGQLERFEGGGLAGRKKVEEGMRENP